MLYIAKVFIKLFYRPLSFDMETNLQVPEYLRSGIAITTISQCIEELVLNSIDAKSNNIAVRVDLQKSKLQVVDKGCGISKDDLSVIGRR